MSVFEKANEIVAQMIGLASVSLGDLIGGVFMSLALFFVDLILGL